MRYTIPHWQKTMNWNSIRALRWKDKQAEKLLSTVVHTFTELWTSYEQRKQIRLNLSIQVKVELAMQEQKDKHSSKDSSKEFWEGLKSLANTMTELEDGFHYDFPHVKDDKLHPVFPLEIYYFRGKFLFSFRMLLESPGGKNCDIFGCLHCQLILSTQEFRRVHIFFWLVITT